MWHVVHTCRPPGACTSSQGTCMLCMSCCRFVELLPVAKPCASSSACAQRGVVSKDLWIMRERLTEASDPARVNCLAELPKSQSCFEGMYLLIG